MPTPERFYQANLVDAPQTDHGDRAEQVMPSFRMEQVITHLAAVHAVNLHQVGGSFAIDIPDCPQRWLIGNIDGERIGVTRCQLDEENRLAPDIDMVFQITLKGWEPVEIVHTDNAWDEFAREMAAQNQAIFDAQGNLVFPVFTDFWAQRIEQAEERCH